MIDPPPTFTERHLVLAILLLTVTLVAFGLGLGGSIGSLVAMVMEHVAVP